MCGFCGIATPNKTDIAPSMLESIRHRGPDSFNTILDGELSLGGCRLSILNRDSSSLITRDDDNRYVLFNGEIYNYREIAHSLGLPIQIGTDDQETKTILELYKRKGRYAFKNFKGMFSIVIIDGNKITMVRDRFGIKPLFYARYRQEIIFASELKAILKHPEISTIFDYQALDEIAVFGYITSPDRTPFAAIRQVPPASVVVFENGNKSTFNYWEPKTAFNEEGYDSEVPIEFADMVRYAVAESLEAQLHHDGNEKGFYLSGGVDSSFVAILASQLHNKPIKTFTLADSNASSDLQMARRVATADRKSTRLNSSHIPLSRMPSSA